MNYRFALPLLVLIVVVSGCDITDPRTDARAGLRSSAVESLGERGVTEFTFEKWFTAYPVMTGNTSLGDGTFAGRILSRTAFGNNVIVKLEALYQITDPSGAQSFTAEIGGTENLTTSSAVLNGVITDGWRKGARVHVSFDVVAPCPMHNRATCFRGTIQVQD